MHNPHTFEVVYFAVCFNCCCCFRRRVGCKALTLIDILDGGMGEEVKRDRGGGRVCAICKSFAWVTKKAGGRNRRRGNSGKMNVSKI